MTPEMYQQLVDKIVEAVPEIAETIIPREITLADVLRAVDDTNTICVDDRGNFVRIYRGKFEYIYLDGKWDLTKPLSLQSDETKTFLHSILCK